MAKFQIGELVQLRSGGPIMTVSAVTVTSVTAVFYNQIKGNFDKLVAHADMLRSASTGPIDPPHADWLRTAPTVRGLA